VDAALYWMAKMLAAGEDPRFLARRMLIFASEDVGMGDPLSLLVATAAAHAVEYVGFPECQFNLAQACIHLATAPKSNSTMGYFEALRKVQEGTSTEVPIHLRDPSRDRKGLGHGAGYKYPHAFKNHWVPQQYLPAELQGQYFYQPGEIGHEKKIKERLDVLRARQRQGLGGDAPP
jgi:putative ATPase